jgi:hypothetical protein
MIRNKFYLVTLLAFFYLEIAAQDEAIQDIPESSIFSTSDQINKIELYPNPAVDYLVAEIKNSNLKDVSFELHSMIGNRISITHEILGENRFRISLDGYAAGYYFLVVRDEYSKFKKAFKFLKN